MSSRSVMMPDEILATMTPAEINAERQKSLKHQIRLLKQCYPHGEAKNWIQILNDRLAARVEEARINRY